MKKKIDVDADVRVTLPSCTVRFHLFFIRTRRLYVIELISLSLCTIAAALRVNSIATAAAMSVYNSYDYELVRQPTVEVSRCTCSSLIDTFG